MEQRFYISVAGLKVEMNYLRESTREFCRDYIIDPPKDGADIIATATPERVEQEWEQGDEGASIENAEQLCLFRDIAENSPAFGSFLFHGAAISYGERAYLFGALSGTGKTTHVRLWRRHLGADVQIVNGDKPLLRVSEQGVDVCATPWAGKEGWQRNCIVPLGAICLLQRGEKNSIERVDPGQYLGLIMQQVYMPRNPRSSMLTFELLDRVLKQVPVYLLHCDISEEAVKTCFPALTGLPYPKKA